VCGDHSGALDPLGALVALLRRGAESLDCPRRRFGGDLVAEFVSARIGCLGESGQILAVLAVLDPGNPLGVGVPDRVQIVGRAA
jgi:hypothetical protein